uniref:Uncharacterized protein n=1 Tax=Timema monikensis TaxID=170555 RepID=A0A7R9EH59_9NEOP|nr:unnamed protein product [Timema monikensis]
MKLIVVGCRDNEKMRKQEKGGGIVHTSQPATQNKALRHYAVIPHIFLVADWMSIVAMQLFTILRPLLELSDVRMYKRKKEQRSMTEAILNLARTLVE